MYMYYVTQSYETSVNSFWGILRYIQFWKLLILLIILVFE